MLSVSLTCGGLFHFLASGVDMETEPKSSGTKSPWVTRLDVLGVLVLSGVFIVWVGIIIFRQHMAGADVEIIRAEAQEGAYRINLNTASGGELMLLPGIGKIRAARILAAREEHGVFRTMAQAREAAGMTEPQWQEVETMTTLGDGDKGGE